MPVWTRHILIVLLALSSWSADAQQEQQLPSVLIIGDRIYSQHARPVVADLKGLADVSMASEPKDTVLNSATAIEHIDAILGRVDRSGKLLPEDQWPRWDLIHINVGLGDLVYRAPGMKSFRVMSIDTGGVVCTEPKQYEKNLDELIGKLKATGAKVIWASTTPIRSSRSSVFKLGSEIEYNKIADRVMRKHRVPTNDMYAHAKSVMDMDRPAPHGFDPFDFDKKPIHSPIVQSISKALGLPVPKPEGEDKGQPKKGGVSSIQQPDGLDALRFTWLHHDDRLPA